MLQKCRFFFWKVINSFIFNSNVICKDGSNYVSLSLSFSLLPSPLSLFLSPSLFLPIFLSLFLS